MPSTTGRAPLDLLFDGSRVEGVRVRGDDGVKELRAKSVVLACGGFEANAAWRTRYLGPGWDLAKVRGSRFNTGDGIRIALAIGASPCGNWSGCHAVQWEMNAPEFGDLAVGDQFQKHSYPFGILINALGKRFVDEGADFRNYTYAKYGRVVLEQPGQFAWQIFDQKVKHLQRDEYKIRQITRVTANTIEEFAQRLDGVNAAEFLRTIREWNKVVRTDVPFNPNIKDGRCTSGLAVDKSNWANTIDTPPFEGYAVTCGVTFTFGGLRVNTEAQVLNTDYQPIRGLYAAGELVGGLFYFNYPGGTGLMSGAVFGKIAGASAGSAPARMKHERDQARARPSEAAETTFTICRQTRIFSLSTKSHNVPRLAGQSDSPRGQTETHDLGCVACVAGRKDQFLDTRQNYCLFYRVQERLLPGPASANGPTHYGQTSTDEMAPVDGNLLRNGPPPSASRMLSEKLGHNSAVSVKERRQWTISFITIRRSSTGQSSFGRTARGSRFTSA